MSFQWNEYCIQLLPLPRKITVSDSSARFSLAGGARQEILHAADGIHPEGYALQISEHGIRIEAGDAAGLFYGRQTLRQLERQLAADAFVGELTIEDYPEYACRGVMLDVSRDRILRMDELKKLIGKFSEWKINHLELYFEHTFAYREHEIVWEHASPFTVEEIRELDQFCRDRFIELVPFQNSLGHLLRWLCHPPYRHLAECPEGFRSSWNMNPKDPFSLCPTDPESLRWIESLLTELLPNFSSGLFVGGCDETYDIGEGRSKTLAGKCGKERLILDYVNQLNQVVRQQRRKLLICADMLVQHPALMKEIDPEIGLIDWGYGIDYPFQEHGELFERNKLDYYFMVSNSAYSAVAGRTYRMFGNICNATMAGRNLKVRGIINSEWGDFGYWHTFTASLAGFAYGAAMSWSPTENEKIDLGGSLDEFYFGNGSGVGDFLLDLGKVYAHVTEENHFCLLFMQLIDYPERAGEEMPKAFTPQGIQCAQWDLRQLRYRLERLNLTDEGTAADLRQMIDMADFAVRLAACRLQSGGAGISCLNQSMHMELSEMLAKLMESHCHLWKLRQRPGDLTASLWWFRRLWLGICPELAFPYETEVNQRFGEGIGR